MNNSNSTALLQKLNDEKAIVLIPAIIFISFLMVTGLIGNTVVCYFYGCKTKTKPTSCFIIGMAILDLLSCIISMPMEIVDMRFFYMFPNATVCKVLRATNFVCTIASGLILLAIAMERYRRICLPFRNQFTVFQARFICLISVLIACLLSWPCLVLYSVIPVDVPTPGSEVIQGYDCTTVRNDSLKVYRDAFNAMQILIFICIVLPLIVLYVLVYRQLNKLKQVHKLRLGQLFFSSKPSVFQNSDNSSPETSNKDKDTTSSCRSNADVSGCKKFKKPIAGRNVAKISLTQVASKRRYMTKKASFVREKHTKSSKNANNDESLRSIELENNSSASQQEEKCHFTEFSQTDENEVPDRTSVNFNTVRFSGDSANIRLLSKYYFHKNKLTHLNKARNTTLMLVITITFVSSFVPYLCLVVWRSLSTDYVVNKMTDIHLVVFSIGIRSYFLNSAMNPMIYGFFNSQFKGLFASLFCAWGGAKYCCKSEIEAPDSLKSKT